MTVNDLEKQLRELALEARSNKLTYCYILAQYEDLEDNTVSWKPMSFGDKSYHPDHLLTQIGQYNVISQVVFQEICDLIEAEDESCD